MNRILHSCFVIVLTCLQAYGQVDCDCWENELRSEKAGYEAAVRDMEKAFVSKGYLKDKKPSSYFLLMDSIIAKNEYYLFGVEFNPILVSRFEKCFLANSCTKTTYEKIRSMSNILMSYKNVSPRQTFSDVKGVFDQADFKESEVKHYFLTFYHATFLQVDLGLLRLVETKDSVVMNKPLVKRNILKIYVAPNDSIFVNENYVQFQELKQIVVEHITDTTNSENSPEIEIIDIEELGKRKVSKQVISFLNHRSTSYDLYIKVQDELTSGYKEARNEIGLIEFGVSYEQMLEQRDEYKKEIKIVRQLLPQRISEAEPINE